MSPRARADRRPVALTAALLRGWPLSAPGEGKDGRGSVLLVGGSAEVPGALLLAAEAALRAGAGKLQAASARAVGSALAVALPEAKVLALPEHRGAVARPTAAFRRAAREADAVAVGCGMDETPATRATARALMRAAGGPVLLDAGALAAVDDRTNEAVLLTPHLGEMAALVGESKTAIERHQADVARAYAREHGIVLALKGATTVVADPDGRTWVYGGGSVGLGTSGSGDVLAGLAVGLLARGAEPAQALAWAVWVHGEAGRRLSRRVARVGFLARELLGELAPVRDALEQGVKRRRRA